MKFIEPQDAFTAPDENGRCEDTGQLTGVARLLRRQVLRMTIEADSGHPTSRLSCAEIVAALFFHEMRWDPADPQARNVDRFVLSNYGAAACSPSSPLVWCRWRRSSWSTWWPVPSTSGSAIIPSANREAPTHAA